MRLHATLIAVMLGCGASPPKTESGPGTEGIVDDPASDGIELGAAPVEKMCVDVSTLRPPLVDLPSDELSPSARGVDATAPPIDDLIAALGGDGDGTVHSIVGIARVSRTAWAFVYTTCGALPVCTSYLGRGEVGDAGYTVTKQDLELADPVSAPDDLTAIAMGIADLNDDGAEELWIGLSAHSADATDVGTIRAYVAAYSVPDVLPLMWTPLGYEPSEPGAQACAADLAFHDLNCDHHADVLVSRTCGRNDCVNGGDCSPDGPSHRREAHVWKPDAGVYFVSEQSWVPRADAEEP